ncbi:MAG: ABC transporter ATP-binding protein/permease [Bacillota bacterium]
MLQLEQIKKTYVTGDEVVEAVCGVDLTFNKSEMVAICGPSGCGKTTMLNIIGGLDKYTSGNLLIDGKETKTFTDSDWDAYRNAEIGFVFQSYNLISHLTVLDNVAMALSLSGVSYKERTERAKKVLAEVGLSSQVNKKTNQMSGGQMQRVAIARALVNNPSIILADEPTGALDSKTSVQIMNILKEIAKDRLVIMVTHNEDLAEEYSTRIIRMLDGKITSDTNPQVIEPQKTEVTKLSNKGTKMSFKEALKSSLKNLLTKKGRTAMTSFAGSIGIIGVALILAVSSGMTSYVSTMEQNMLAGFPIMINDTTSVSTGMSMSVMMGDGDSSDTTTTTDGDVFYSYDSEANTAYHDNIITQEYLDYVWAMDEDYYSAITYTRSMTLNVVAQTGDASYKMVSTSSSMSFYSSSDFFEIPDSQSFIESQYNLLGDSVYPTEYNQLALVVDADNTIDTSLLEALGITVTESYTIEDLLGTTFKVVLNDDYYTTSGNMYVGSTDYEAMYNSENSIEVTIVAVMQLNDEATTEFLSTGVGYTTALTEMVLAQNMTSEIVTAQVENPEINVLTGLEFSSSTTYDDILASIGGSDLPSDVQIYPTSYEYKDAILAYLEAYNEGKDSADCIYAFDLAATISSTMTSMISIITIILAAFAGISLVVSSVMIGIITYVSVVERTKEIGVMRAIGARKKDISRIFNAEALAIGGIAGLVGVGITYLLCIPLTLLVTNLTGVTFTVLLSAPSAIALILLSMGLTFVAGLIPSRIAAKKDPVVALRTET